MENICQHLFVSGRVQGVSFRAFTQERALKYGLKGWVRNLSDGRVEALALGPTDKIESFLKDLKSGPPAAQVENIEVKSLEHPPNLEDFQIAPSANP